MLSSICPDVGLLLSEGTIVDAMIVQAPSSTKNRDRDPEMGSTKKETSWYFGLKAARGERSPRTGAQCGGDLGFGV